MERKGNVSRVEHYMKDFFPFFGSKLLVSLLGLLKFVNIITAFNRNSISVTLFEYKHHHSFSLLKNI